MKTREASVSPSWRCRPYRPGDESGIVTLLQASFPSWPNVGTSASPVEHLQWKLASHPLAAQFTPVAESDRRIVGVRIFMVKEVILTGRDALTYSAIDIAVHPDFRELGLYKDLAALDYAELDGRTCADTFNFKLNYDSDHEAIQATAKTYPGRARVENGLIVLACTASSSLKNTASSGISVSTVSTFDERQDDFWCAAARPFDFIAARGTRFMNWRYGDSRAGHFEIIIAEAGDELLGYAVYRHSRDRDYIADLLALPTRCDVIEALVLRVLERAIVEPGEARVECWLPRCHPYRVVLEDIGFIHVRDGPTFTYRPGTTPAADLHVFRDPELAMHMTAGDTDLI